MTKYTVIPFQNPGIAAIPVPGNEDGTYVKDLSFEESIEFSMKLALKNLQFWKDFVDTIGSLDEEGYCVLWSKLLDLKGRSKLSGCYWLCSDEIESEVRDIVTGRDNSVKIVEATQAESPDPGEA